MDVLTTHRAVELGFFEYNFILNWVYKRFGTKGHVFFKICTTIMFVGGALTLSVEALLTICIVFALVVINNLWVIENATRD